MKLSVDSDYAIRMLMYCNSKNGIISVREISQQCKLPFKLMTRIVIKLNEAGFIDTIRGRNGGIKLAKKGNKIKLGDVVRVVEGKFLLAECFDETVDQQCPLIEFCKIRVALHSALKGFFDILNTYSLDDITTNHHTYSNILAATSVGR